jgi:hypothetical protein
MRLGLDDWKNGWFGVDVALAPSEIDELIDRLRLLQEDPAQHFHLSSKYAGSGGVGQVTFSVETAMEESAVFSGPALHPGDEVGGGGSEV